MSTTKQRRGFKGKVVLRTLHTFEPEIIQRAYEEDGKLFLELPDGDAMIIDYVHLCEDEDAAWELYADYIEEAIGKRPTRRTK